MTAVSAGDVVATHAQAAACERPPLLILDPLREFLDARGLGAGTLRAEPLGDGHSNVTYLIERDDLSVVLRRPPRPPVAPSTHDMLREAGILNAIVPAGVRAPVVLATCDDEAVIGAVFYVTELLDGHVITQVVPPSLDTLADRRRIGLELVDALAEVHGVDVHAAGLGGLGRPDGYLARQLRRFGELAVRGATRTIPELEQVRGWLEAALPRHSDATLVHGDFRLGNVLFAPESPARLAGILDWEMATIGDPLADVGYLLATYARPGEPWNPMLALSEATRAPGFPETGELRDRYEQRSGRSTAGLVFYEVLALWKAAIFLEVSYRRHLAGTTDDPFFARLDEGVPLLAREAWRRARAAG
ncbi:phosphotransferase family protein [Conexibacter woesei]|uniref:Aminoglycoside phosphotransferase n=1 Tax=Conexibacter woesei (strain DSM 14684 / CCUG 47730 / CIP 108061 / JCM 11494 / NBRC 100937 / ID131577) TaxID=469383 RepID=D3FAJ9_CONWI|nr:phosphotransferase family protein [Conexibacter woesei]ADB49268.1 aminoglycoside phosphotransferase [Conexibacter woesei DSM 14684]